MKNPNWLEIFDENTIENLIFFYFLKLAGKNRAFGNNIIFVQHFLISGVPISLPTLAAPMH